jgi:hypothetical protein
MNCSGRGGPSRHGGTEIALQLLAADLKRWGATVKQSALPGFVQQLLATLALHHHLAHAAIRAGQQYGVVARSGACGKQGHAGSEQ